MENSKENELYEKLFKGIEKGIEEAVGKTELDDLMEKIYTSIDMSNEKQDRINNKEEELKNEVRPVMIEEGKEELKELVEDKKEFDEMTKNAMIQAKLDIIEAREELQKYYVENTSKLLKKQEIVEKRLKDAKIARNLSDEKLIHAEIIANKTIEDIQNELKDTEKYYSKQIGILDGYEYDINNSEIGMTITEEEVESAKKIREPEIQEPDQEQEPTQQPTQGQQQPEQKPVQQPTQGQQQPEQKPVQQPTQGQQKPGQKPVQQPTQGQQQLNPRAVPEIIFGRKTTIKDNEKNIEWSSSNNKRNEITNKNFGELKEWLESDEIKNKFEENKFVIDSILLKGLVNALEQKIIGLEEVKNAITAMMNRNKKVLENIIKIRYDKSDLSKWTFPWNKKNRDIVAQSADRYERTAEVVGEYEPNPFKRLLKRMKIRALPAGKNERKETIVNKDQETKGIVTEQYIALSTKFEELENRNDIDKWLDEVNDKYNAKEINDEEFMELYKRGSEEAKLIQKDKNKAFRDSMTQNEVNENINNENNNTETEKKQEEPTQQEEGR